MRRKVFVTRRLPAEVLDFIAANCELRIWDQEDIPVPRALLEQEIADVDGLFCLITENIDRELLRRAQHLKVISNMAVGFNNIDIQAATQQGILVTNTPGVLTETTADLTFALLLATARRLAEASNVLRSGDWKTWSPMMLTGQDIFGATLGIIGMGRIGEAVAKRGKGFSMDVLYCNRTRKRDVEETLGVRYAELEQLLRESDFVCVLAPYTSETKGLIGKKELALMKSSAILINTARGGIVDEQALYEALKSGEIWAAGLDVFETEPIPLEHPLLQLPNVVAIPHIGSASIKTRTAMAQMAANHLVQGVTGRIPQHIVNRGVLKG
ncbi:D-glycerate dehydrogenase [Fodinisporobacter ferrooxydans]|uniref:D-glycerate dehydrogenase n=1 Tax=Fodinisporobacter ferrooxydans TaxID=2901836 RepID=A0ABY4CHJ7_9BACL|nr:D-glycerate dehydrogenase [Alicyclobacillaceae bacterium MYW30-H2]